MDDLPEDQKLLGYMLGAADDLKKKNLMAGSVGLGLTPKGIAMFDQIKAAGFKPTDEQIAETLAYLCGTIDPGILRLFIAYRDGEIKDEDETS